MQLDLELYRQEFEAEPGVTLSVIDVCPERPLHTFFFVHGFGGDARQWQYQFDAFSQHNHAIAADMRGHGQSAAPPNGYDMGRLVADLMATLKYLDVQQKIILVGHSFGVAIATEFATKYPERVSHLVLIAGAGEYKIPYYYRLAFRLPEEILLAVQPFVSNWVDASLPALKQIYFSAMRPWQGWDQFPQLKMPTMVILGNKDQVLPQEAFERVAELVPPQNSEVIRVDVSAHMVMLERRDAVNRAVIRFVEKDMPGQLSHRWRVSGDSGRGGLLRERPWLAYYESDVPPTIHVPDQPLTRILERAHRRFPNQTAIFFYQRSLTYANLYDQAACFANGLHELGVSPGARIILLLPNVPQMVIAYYGALFAGCVAVMVNPLASQDELVREAQLVGADVIVALTFFAEKARYVQQQAPIKHLIWTSYKDYLTWRRRIRFTLYRERKEGHRLPQPLLPGEIVWSRWLRSQPGKAPDVTVKPQDTAVIQFTGGTTGLPKPVQLSHRNLLANTLQVRVWLTNTKDGAETVLCVVPFSHIYGMTVGMNVPILQGATMILLPTFQVEEVLETIRDHEPSYFPGVPAIFMQINNFPGVRKYNIQSIQACLSGAAPMPVEVEEAFEKLTKGRIIEGYGLSEAAPLTHLTPLDGRDKVGSIGLPLPSTEARIVDLQTGRPLPPGQIGELVIRGPQVMLGYWEDTERTKTTVDTYSWLHTGDIARMDEDGYFQIISRRQDIGFAVGSDEPIYPRDIEEVIYELPEVDEVVVAVVANRPVAFVRLKKHAKLSAKTIIKFCEHRLPPNQAPKWIFFMQEFPRNLIGKALRRELVAEVEKQLTAEAGSVGPYLYGFSGAESAVDAPDSQPIQQDAAAHLSDSP